MRFSRASALQLFFSSGSGTVNRLPSPMQMKSEILRWQKRLGCQSMTRSCRRESSEIFSAAPFRQSLGRFSTSTLSGAQ